MRIGNFVYTQLKENWGFILVMLLLFASRSSLADWYDVPTGSMKPTIVEGDRVFVDKTAYRIDLPFTNIGIIDTGSPERGDIVVFESQKADDRLIKRVIAVAGDVVSMRDNRLVINGETLTYHPQAAPHAFEEISSGHRHQVQFVPALQKADRFNPVIVPENHVLVLGDNRNNSMDSRYYGFVPLSEIQGKATRIVFSLDSDNYYLPRLERGLTPLI